MGLGKPLSLSAFPECWVDKLQESKAMSEFEFSSNLGNKPGLTWQDRTYKTESGLRRFLKTLSVEQLAEAEVLVDDSSFVVFFPIFLQASKATTGGFQFDLSEKV